MILLFGIDPLIGWCFYPFIVRNSKELELQKNRHAKFILFPISTHEQSL
jgi:hypothetical protein